MPIRNRLQDAIDHSDRPTVLHEGDDRGIYWLGIPDETAFRCNTYLIRDGDAGILVDPGSRQYFPIVRDRVAQIMPPEAVTGMILSHQDPDVAASMGQWLALNPDITVFATPRTQVLLPHYGIEGYEWHDMERNPEHRLPSGARLRFIPAPFLHFPGAVATHDDASGYLFSGDIWAALDTDWRLLVEDFEAHRPKLDLFHTEYMASNLAARGFLHQLDRYPVEAILPQHGSIIGPDHVELALDYLYRLRCGTDIIYADIE
ncbi:MBL fold metallo-hydrolase [Arhodomonas sp. SL1]|uniref:MBL fold metallo-hydrolase n=1 Tax=Arhodomonas sp. SL1 TaxID=3425691 RepID=UPI003F88250C